MIIDLNKILPEGQEIKKNFKPAAIGLDIKEAIIKQDISLELQISKINRGFRFLGSLRGLINIQCARCLEFYPYPISTPFELVYLPLAEAKEGEIELKDRDMNVSFLPEEKVDLRELVREQILLLLPMKPLCSEDCRGLCPRCGVNLNLKQCKCNSKRIDPRLEPLKKIKGLFKMR